MTRRTDRLCRQVPETGRVYPQERFPQDYRRDTIPGYFDQPALVKERLDLTMPQRAGIHFKNRRAMPLEGPRIFVGRFTLELGCDPIRAGDDQQFRRSCDFRDRDIEQSAIRVLI